MTQTARALLIATMDTKGREALFISNCLEQAGISVLLMDAGIRGASDVPVDISREEVAQAGGKSLVEVQNIGHGRNDRAARGIRPGGPVTARDGRSPFWRGL